MPGLFAALQRDVLPGNIKAFRQKFRQRTIRFSVHRKSCQFYFQLFRKCQLLQFVWHLAERKVSISRDCDRCQSYTSSLKHLYDLALQILHDHHKYLQQNKGKYRRKIKVGYGRNIPAYRPQNRPGKTFQHGCKWSMWINPRQYSLYNN